MIISKRNFTVDTSFSADGKEYFMCNFSCTIPHTQLSKVKNCIFRKCNFFGCEVDGSNVLLQSNVIDISYIPPEKTEVELKERITQLEDYIISNNLPIPAEVSV